MDKRVQRLQAYIVCNVFYSGGVSSFVFKKLDSKGRVQRKKYVVVPETIETPDWLYTEHGFRIANDALKYFGFGFQFTKIAIDCRNSRFFFYELI